MSSGDQAVPDGTSEYMECPQAMKEDANEDDEEKEEEEEWCIRMGCGFPHQRFALLSAIICVAATACASFACALPHWARNDDQHLGLWQLCNHTSNGTLNCTAITLDGFPCRGAHEATRILSALAICFCFTTAIVAFMASLSSEHIDFKALCTWCTLLTFAFITTLLCLISWLWREDQFGCNLVLPDYCFWVQVAAVVLCFLAVIGILASHYPKRVTNQAGTPVDPCLSSHGSLSDLKSVPPTQATMTAHPTYEAYWHPQQPSQPQPPEPTFVQPNSTLTYPLIPMVPQGLPALVFPPAGTLVGVPGEPPLMQAHTVIVLPQIQLYHLSQLSPSTSVDPLTSELLLTPAITDPSHLQYYSQVGLCQGSPAVPPSPPIPRYIAPASL